MGFKEDNKEKYLNPFKRIIVKVKTSLNGITVFAEVVGNRIRISVPKDKSGNLTGTLVENIALENSTWIFEPVDDAEIENRIDKALHPRKHMDLSKFDIEKGILPKEELEDLYIPVQYRKDYSPFAKRVLEHPREDVRKSAIEHIEDEDVIAAIVLYSNNKKISLFALDYINDKSILMDIVRNDFNYYYFTAAVDIFYDEKSLALKLFDKDVRKVALERIEDEELIFDLAFECERWYRPILMIRDNDLLSKKEFEKLNLFAENKEIREIIKDRLNK